MYVLYLCVSASVCDSTMSSPLYPSSPLPLSPLPYQPWKLSLLTPTTCWTQWTCWLKCPKTSMITLCVHTLSPASTCGVMCCCCCCFGSGCVLVSVYVCVCVCVCVTWHCSLCVLLGHMRIQLFTVCSLGSYAYTIVHCVFIYTIDCVVFSPPLSCPLSSTILPSPPLPPLPRGTGREQVEHSQGSPRVRPPPGLQAQTGTRRLQRTGQDTGQGELLSCIAGCDRTVSLEREYVMAVDEVP